MRSHPNVVKLYGYCLEPPTVCLILELLPTSLKDVLYPPAASSSTSAGEPSSSFDVQHVASAIPDSSMTTRTVQGVAVTLSSNAAERFSEFGVQSGAMLRGDQPADAEVCITQQDPNCVNVHTVEVRPTASRSLVQVPCADSQLGCRGMYTPSQAWQGSSTFNGVYDEAPQGKRKDARGSEPNHLPSEAVKPSNACAAQKQQQQSLRPSLLRVLQIAADVAAGLEHLHSRPLLAKAHSLMLAAVNEAGDGQGSTEALSQLVEKNQGEGVMTAFLLSRAGPACVTQTYTSVARSRASSGQAGSSTVSSGGAVGPRIVHRGG
jgi:hypothetical protein